jgi:integrase
MSAKLEKTRTPGIFRRGSRYAFSYRVNGKQKWESCRTLDEARRAKAARTTDVGRGEFEARSRVTLHEYALEWIERYSGRGRRGFRESTRDDYKRVLEQYVFKHFGERIKLTEVTPAKVAGYIAWLCKQTKPAPTEKDKDRRVPLSDKSVRNYLGPLSACMASAVREGLLRTNPTRDADLPHRPTADEVEHEDVRVMTDKQLSTLLALLPDAHRVFFWFLAGTGLRISEAIGLQWRHLQLDGSSPHVKVRRGVVRGRLGPPKTRHSRRDVPLDAELVFALRRVRSDSEWPGDEHLVFPASNGAYLHVGNLRRRVLKPAREEAGLPWVGFHTFRHTCASMLFAQGRNAVQVQHWLGHHSAAFTLSTYVHLLDSDLGEALGLPSTGANKVRTAPTPGDTVQAVDTATDLAA